MLSLMSASNNESEGLIALTPGGELALRSSSVTPALMRARTSYAISGTDPHGYTRTVSRNVTSQDHASTTINHLAATGWTRIELYSEAF